MGLGGNVEEVGILPNSQVKVKLTRGHFFVYREDGKYSMKDMIENNGVEPHVRRTIELKDVRDDYMEYVKDISEQAIKLIK